MNYTLTEKILEWNLPQNKEGLIKFYVCEKNKDLMLCLLTTTLPITPLKIDLCLNQLSKLSVWEIFNIYKELLDEYVAKNQKRGVWAWFTRLLKVIGFLQLARMGRGRKNKDGKPTTNR